MPVLLSYAIRELLPNYATWLKSVEDVRSTEMEKSAVTKSTEQPLSDPATVDADAVFLYLTCRSQVPYSGSSDIMKRAIRRKAAVCVVRDGVLYVQKKKKDNSVSVLGLMIRSRANIIWGF